MQSDLRTYILERCQQLEAEEHQHHAFVKVEWHDALIKSPFKPGDHCVWVYPIYANDGTGRMGIEATFVQIIPYAGNGEGENPIIYRMPDWGSEEDWEKHKRRKQRALEYAIRVYGEPLSSGWYLCDDTTLINEATYHEWEQRQEYLKRPRHRGRGKASATGLEQVD